MIHESRCIILGLLEIYLTGFRWHISIQLQHPLSQGLDWRMLVHHLWLIVLDIESWWGVFSTLHTRSKISYVVGSFFRYMQEPHELHWKETKRILRYVKGTTIFGIHYAVVSSLDLVGYIDSDWVVDRTDCKSTSRYVLYLGSWPICRSSKK